MIPESEKEKEDNSNIWTGIKGIDIYLTVCEKVAEHTSSGNYIVSSFLTESKHITFV